MAELTLDAVSIPLATSAKAVAACILAGLATTMGWDGAKVLDGARATANKWVHVVKHLILMF